MKTFLALFFWPSRIYQSIHPERLGRALTFSIVCSTLFNFTVWFINELARAFSLDFIGLDTIQSMGSSPIKFESLTRFFGVNLKMDGSLLEVVSKLLYVMITPYVILATLVFATLSVWIGLKIFVSPNSDEVRSRYNFKTLLALQAYTVGFQFLFFIPYAGPLLASCWSFVYSVRGIRSLYHVSLIRSVCILSLPLIAAVTIVFVLGLLVSLLIGGMIGARA